MLISRSSTILMFLFLVLTVTLLLNPVVSIGKNSTEQYKVLILGTQEDEVLDDAVILGDRIYAIGWWSRGTIVVSMSPDLSDIEVYSYEPAHCTDVEVVDEELILACMGPVVVQFNPSTFYLEDYTRTVFAGEYLGGSEHILKDHYLVYMNEYGDAITIAQYKGVGGTALDIGLKPYGKLGELLDTVVGKDFSCIVTYKYIIILNSSYVPQYILKAPQNIMFRSATFINNTLIIVANHPVGILLLELDAVSGRTIAAYVIPTHLHHGILRVRSFGTLIVITGDYNADGFVALMTIDGKLFGFLDIGSKDTDVITSVVVTRNGIVAIGWTYANNSSAIHVEKLDLKAVRGSIISLKRIGFTISKRSLSTLKPYGGMVVNVTDLVMKAQNLKHRNMLIVSIPWSYIGVSGTENVVPTSFSIKSYVKTINTTMKTFIRTLTVIHEITKTVTATAIVSVPQTYTYTVRTTVTLPEKVKTIINKITETVTHTRTIVVPVTSTITKIIRSTITFAKPVTYYIVKTTKIIDYATKTITKTVTNRITMLKTIEITNTEYRYREPSLLAIAIAIALVVIGIVIAFRYR